MQNAGILIKYVSGDLNLTKIKIKIMFNKIILKYA